MTDKSSQFLRFHKCCQKYLQYHRELINDEVVAIKYYEFLSVLLS
jgi:hypothetical protein